MDKAQIYTETTGEASSVDAYWIKASDGVRLRIAYWRTTSPTHGSVLFFPGRADYIEQYGRIAASLVERGYSVLVIDWRGQGLSDRSTNDTRMGHVDRFVDYQNDVASMIQAATELGLPKPWHLIGQSMGGCIGLRAVIQGIPVESCAFTSPMWDIHLAPAARLAVRPLTWAAQAIGKGKMYAPGYNGVPYVQRAEFDGNTFTNDPAMYQFWVDLATELPDCQIGGPSMGWLYQALVEMRHLARLPSPSLPCIAFCGDQDHIVAEPAIAQRMKDWPGGSYELVDNAKHDLLLETPTIREAVMDKICKLFAENG